MNSEPKKAAALRRELAETNDMLQWVCRCINKYNEDAERPLCPSLKTQCGIGANCANCWLRAALSEVDRG